jgi:UMF1 family MFS transporter
MVGAAALLVFLAAPVLGAVADFSAAKKKFLLAFAYTGALFTLLLYFSHSGDVARTMVFFLITQVSFIGANVMYDAFLPQIASDREMDRVSAKGYAFGYIGGGVQFALALVLISKPEWFGMSAGLAARTGIAMAGLWWAGFTIVTWRGLHEPESRYQLPEQYRRWPRAAAMVAVGLERTIATTKRVRRFRHLVLFLLAFMFYNEGIQTVINMAAAYGSEELKFTPQVLMGTLLVIQFVAMGGALLFGKLIAPWLGTKRAIMAALVIWSGVVVYAYQMNSPREFFALGVIVGLVMGGSQALSRSYYGSMVPEDASAEFYGFYTVFTKFSSIWGPFAFGAIKQMTGSSRLAILSLIVFFLAGLTLLWLVNEEKAREARSAGAF